MANEWKSLGGIITGDLVVGQNADGRLEVFVQSNGAIYHKWQTAPNSGWSSSWAKLNGVLDISHTAVGRNQDGCLELFIRVNVHTLYHNGAIIYHRRQTEPNGNWSPSWVSLRGFETIRDPGVIGFGVVYGDFDMIGDPVVGQNADGRLEVFVRRTDGTVYHRWQTEITHEWSLGWSSLGGNIQLNPHVASNADGRLEVFARGIDDAVYHRWQTGSENNWNV